MNIAGTAAVITVVFIVVSFLGGFGLGTLFGYNLRKIDEVLESIKRWPKA